MSVESTASPLTPEEESILEALGREFMRPFFEQADNWQSVMDEHGETALVPGDVYSPEDFPGETEPAAGWFWRLSAPGYLDCTDWSGPFDTYEEAARDLIAMHGDGVTFEEEDGDFS